MVLPVSARRYDNPSYHLYLRFGTEATIQGLKANKYALEINKKSQRIHERAQ